MIAKNNRRQLGYTLIELSIGLAIVSAVLVAMMAGVQKIMEQSNLNQTVNQIARAAEKIRLIIKRDSDTTFVTLPNMTLPVNNAFATSSVINPGAANVEVYTALGNRVVVYNNSNSNSSQHFRIWMGNVTPGTCVDLAGSLEGVANGMWILNNGWQRVKDDRVSVSFNAATARQFCLTNAQNEIWIEFLK
jgi:prepilin-type N-terminal cleavage/methylation domain-containing protein